MKKNLKGYLLYLLLFFTENSFGQNLQQLNDSLVFCVTKGDFGKALYYGEKMKPFMHLDSGMGVEYKKGYWWSMATCYKQLGKKQELIESLLFLEKWFMDAGKTGHPDFAMVCNEAGFYYAGIKEYFKAEQYWNKSRTVLKNQDEGANTSYVAVTNHLAVLLRDQKKYDRSGLLFEEAIQKAKKGGFYKDIAEVIFNLAKLKILQGRYGEASDLLFDILLNGNNFSGITDRLLVDIATELGIIQNEMGLFLSAHSILRNTSIQVNKNYGQYNPDFYRLMLILGDICLANHKTDEALYYYTYSYNTAIRVFGDKSPETINTRVARAKLLNNTLHPEIALDTLREVYHMMKSMNPDSSGSLFYSYFLERGKTHLLLKEYALADSFFNKAKEFAKAQVGYPAAYIEVLNNTAVLYARQGDTFRAGIAISEIVSLQSKHLPRRHPAIDKQWERSVLLSEEMGAQDVVAGYLMAYSGTKVAHIRELFNFYSEYEKNNFLDKNVSLLEHINSSAYNYNTTDEIYLETRYLMNAALKSLTLSDTYRMLQDARGSKDPGIISRLHKMDSLKTWLKYQYSLPATKRSKELDWVRLQSDFLEKSLRKDLNKSNQQDAFEADFEINAYKKNLAPDEAAIEFVRFRLRTNRWTDSIMYGAYILKKNETMPQFIPLFEEKQLQKIFDSAGTTATSMVSKFYRGGDIKNKSTAAALGAELYKLTWRPLEPYLSGISKVSYAPAGKLYSIAFHALPVDSGRTLMDKYTLQQYTSTRQVALRKQDEQSKKIKSITLFGDAAFAADSVIIRRSKEIDQEKAPSSNITSAERGTRGGNWASLPGTADEVKKIRSVFEKSLPPGEAGQIITRTFTQKNATEENLKALSGQSPYVLHIATHGFFLPEPRLKARSNNDFGNENSYNLADDPLLRSGLIFAGGNYAWSGKTPIEGIEDGIATAYEISQLNLSNTELVVLSACETALGDVKGSEGVFGLQRAFKMAGVKKMIVSLWQVPDKETAELMTAFYSYWLKGKTINEAFAQAQAEMRKKYSPYYWAAFVLVE
ncbi:MAG: CHAT domain-containing protein [Chitinophagaceae bacterium]|nr:CHAT domain-containing protein [Chitinophagaceae bacterium]